MGTRADFYTGIDKNAKWLGSIAWDGGEALDDLREVWGDGFILDEEEWEQAVDKFLKTRDDATFPEMGWPWPWDDSSLTDVAFAFHDEKQWISWGKSWLDYDEYVKRIQTLNDNDDDKTLDRYEQSGIKTDWPDMSDRKNVRWDKGSGLIILGG